VEEWWSRTPRGPWPLYSNNFQLRVSERSPSRWQKVMFTVLNAPPAARRRERHARLRAAVTELGFMVFVVTQRGKLRQRRGVCFVRRALPPQVRNVGL